MSDFYDGFSFNEKFDMLPETVELWRDEAQPCIDTLENGTEIADINHAIEAYNILKCIKAYKRLGKNKDRENAYYKIINNKLYSYASSITPLMIPEHLKSLSWQYEDDFWGMIVEYNLYKIFAGDDFAEMLNRLGDFHIRGILKQKKLVEAFDTQITDYIRNHHMLIELILDYYLTGSEKTIFLPKTLSQNDYDEMLEAYVEDENHNPNYLSLLENAPKHDKINISDLIKLKARRAYKKAWAQFVSPQSGMSLGAEVAFSNKPDSVVIKNEDGVFQSYNYDRSWFDENLDNPTILQNFIYKFGFTDFEMRSSFSSFQYEMGPLEAILGVHGIKEYPVGTIFSNKRITKSIQMRAYANELLRHDIYMEDVFKWFFEEYLHEEFNVEGFVFNAPSHNLLISEKCVLLAKEIDAVLKQFSMYVKYGEIDRELFEISSGHEAFRNVPSMIPTKYGYLEGKNVQLIMGLMFSNQSMLSFIERTKDEHLTLVQLLMSDNVRYDEYNDFQKEQLNTLLESKIIDINAEGYLKPDYEITNLLYDMYLNEVVCMSYHPEYVRVANKYGNIGNLRIESKLFSEPEQKYLNFILNKEEFSNGYDLRNKACHGNLTGDETESTLNYAEFLKVFVLIIIKINEEFCLKQSLQK